MYDITSLFLSFLITSTRGDGSLDSWGYNITPLQLSLHSYSLTTSISSSCSLPFSSDVLSNFTVGLIRHNQLLNSEEKTVIFRKLLPCDRRHLKSTQAQQTQSVYRESKPVHAWNENCKDNYL